MERAATGVVQPSRMSNLERLESEAIHILREAVAEARTPRPSLPKGSLSSADLAKVIDELTTASKSFR